MNRRTFLQSVFALAAGSFVGVTIPYELRIVASVDESKLADAIGIGPGRVASDKMVADVEVDCNMLWDAVVLEAKDIGATWTVDEFAREFGVDLRTSDGT